MFRTFMFTQHSEANVVLLTWCFRRNVEHFVVDLSNHNWVLFVFVIKPQACEEKNTLNIYSGENTDLRPL